MKHARSLLPSFETAARKSERPPQDDGVVCCMAAFLCGTERGRKALLDYVAHLESLLQPGKQN
jgi:hypothetical protein